MILQLPPLGLRPEVVFSTIHPERDEYTQRKIEKLRYLRLKLRAKIKKRAQAREIGASLASRRRDLDYAKCPLVKMWLVDNGCGYDIVSKR